MHALIVGATGFIGRKLAAELIDRDHAVVCMVRDRDSEAAHALGGLGCELRAADLTEPASLAPAVEGVDVLYYLAHLMSNEEDDDLVEAEAAAAGEVGRAARRAGIELVVYLGGLGDPSASEHLRGRACTAEALRAEGPAMTYFRAAMIVGSGSGSYVLLRSLVERLPAMISPEWLENRTQPIGVDAVVGYLADAPFVAAARGREIQLGGPDAITYAEMVDGMAAALGEKAPRRLPTPDGIHSEAMGRLAGAVMRGDARVAAHLTAGLETDTMVDDPSGMALFRIEPEPYRLSLARAIEEDFRAADAKEVAR